ncbi:hypothetical protein Tco_0961660, partial [Tanacetum coccineum]
MKALTMMFGYENLCIDIVEAYMLKYDCPHGLFRGTINVLGIFCLFSEYIFRGQEQDELYNKVTSLEKKQKSQAAGRIVKCMIKEAMKE